MKALILFILFSTTAMAKVADISKTEYDKNKYWKIGYEVAADNFPDFDMVADKIDEGCKQWEVSEKVNLFDGPEAEAIIPVSNLKKEYYYSEFGIIPLYYRCLSKN